MPAAVITTSQYTLIPGRLRIAVKRIQQNPTFAEFLSKQLMQEKRIGSVTANALTGRVLIYFDKNQINVSEIQYLISSIEQRYPIQKTSLHRQSNLISDKRPSLIAAPLFYTAVSGIILAVLLLKRLTVGRSSFSSSSQIFNLAGVATLLAGYPFLRNHFETIAKKNNINHELALFLPALLLLTMRESIIGVSALWLVQLAYLFGVNIQDHSRKSISNILIEKSQMTVSNSIEENHVEKKNSREKRITSSSLYPDTSLWWTFSISGIVFFFTRDFMRSLAVLLAGCPAPMALARSAALNRAMGQAAAKEIFVRKLEALERLSQVDTVLFDKTGTLTTTEPIIAKIIPLTPEYNENQILVLAASSEISVHHPLAHMLIREVQRRNLSLLPITHQARLSFGVQSTIGDKNIAVGNRLFMQRKKISVTKAKSMISSLEQVENSIIYIAANKQLIGILTVRDFIKPESYTAMNQLYSLGIKDIVLITGDSSSAANNVMNELGITVGESSMLPNDKVRIIQEKQHLGKIIAMVGDGTNDSPAFTASDIGIAMGISGTSEAIENADIVIGNDDPRKVSEIIRLSKDMRKATKQNILLSSILGKIGIVLAATALITPVTAGMLLNASTLAVLLNTKRVLSSKKSHSPFP